MKTPLVYILHCGNFYGTEQMALATLEGLSSEYTPILIAPEGVVIAKAEEKGIKTYAFRNLLQLSSQLHEVLSNYYELMVMSTGVKQALLLSVWNIFYRRKLTHLHIIHGGTDERESYGRKAYLNYFPVRFIAVSYFVRSRLIAHGVKASSIDVVENFLLPERVAKSPKRPQFTRQGIQHIVVVSRIDPIKRIDVLLDALDLAPDLLQHLEITILGTGWNLDEMRERAAKYHPQVQFLGFVSDVPQRLANADLLLHLCPTEPFGLAILEAMAADLPVLIPNTGGAAALVENEVSGLHFKANNPEALAKRLRELLTAEPEYLNRLVAGARQAVETRFSAEQGIANYHALLTETHS
ncbi:MAG: glycosyltransferase family 4 protein [Thiotrichaceae bacterium]|nr:glycosyltransferase family 4 protein [Thiotrichaceae bacterium]